MRRTCPRFICGSLRRGSLDWALRKGGREGKGEELWWPGLLRAWLSSLCVCCSEACVCKL